MLNCAEFISVFFIAVNKNNNDSFQIQCFNIASTTVRISGVYNTGSSLKENGIKEGQNGQDTSEQARIPPDVASIDLVQYRSFRHSVTVDWWCDTKWKAF